jgi:thymidylate synthase (FAD)
MRSLISLPVTAVALQPRKIDENVQSAENVAKVLDNGFIALDGAFASDLAVANGARVSFNLASQEMTAKDEGLIRFLMRDHHGSPFEHGYFRFIVKAPLFVVREHHRHRAGHSYNEWSGRYSKMQAEFYIPTNVRTQIGKPGAYTFEPVDDQTREATRAEIEHQSLEAFAAYERMLEMGVAKEVARTVLPLNMYTTYYWSCNPRSLMHFCALRNSEFAQYEIREFARAAEGFLEQVMPATHAAFVENGRTAP